jgi:hypothetical protein
LSASDRARVALEPSVSADNVDTASWDLGWNFKGTRPASDDGFKEDVYELQDDSDTRIHLVHDSVLKLRYLIITGPKAQAVADRVPEHLETIAADEAENRYKQADSSEDKVAGLYLQAIAGADGKVPATFKDALKDDAVNTRKGVVVALGYVGGDAALKLLDEIADSDASDTVREDAATMARIVRASA